MEVFTAAAVILAALVLDGPLRRIAVSLERLEEHADYVERHGMPIEMP